MATIGRLAKIRRISKLTERPEVPNGTYCTSCRDGDGKPRRQRVTSDRKESEQICRRWVIEHYDHAADIVIRDGPGFKGDLEQRVEAGVEVRLYQGPQGKEIFIVCRSSARREKERAMHDRFEKRIEDDLARLTARLQRGQEET